MSDSPIMRSPKFGTVSGAIAEAESVQRYQMSILAGIIEHRVLLCHSLSAKHQKLSER